MTWMKHLVNAVHAIIFKAVARVFFRAFLTVNRAWLYNCMQWVKSEQARVNIAPEQLARTQSIEAKTRVLLAHLDTMERMGSVFR